MRKKETIDNNTESVAKEVKVIFHNSYIGVYGNFQKDKMYTISCELLKIFKADCKEI